MAARKDCIAALHVLADVGHEPAICEAAGYLENDGGDPQTVRREARLVIIRANERNLRKKGRLGFIYDAALAVVNAWEEDGPIT